MPFKGIVVALGRQRLADGVRSVPGIRPEVRRPVVRTAVSTSGPREGKSVMFLVALGKRARRRLVTLETSRLRQPPNL